MIIPEEISFLILEAAQHEGIIDFPDVCKYVHENLSEPCSRYSVDIMVDQVLKQKQNQDKPNPS